MKDELVIQVYETDNGKCPYLEWENRLTTIVRAKISAKLARVRLGNFGDSKSIQGTKGIYELRIYFGKEGKKVILLLLGGDKGSQKKDIKKSYQLWQDYLKRGKNG